MRKTVVVFLGLLFYANSVLCQIYYKEIIYVFNYKIIKENEPAKSGLMYLGCLGKPWALSELQRQAAVVWTTDRKYLDKKTVSTGIYEEKDRIWLHPPRSNEFSILEYSPFPQIRFPVSENKSWKRSFAPGKNWVNEKYNIKEEDVLEFDYKNTGTASYGLKCRNKSIQCWEIRAESINLENKTSFIGLFSPEYGFVKMVFENVDKSIITLEIVQIENWKKENQLPLYNYY